MRSRRARASSRQGSPVVRKRGDSRRYKQKSRVRRVVGSPVGVRKEGSRRRHARIVLSPSATRRFPYLPLARRSIPAKVCRELAAVGASPIAAQSSKPHTAARRDGFDPLANHAKRRPPLHLGAVSRSTYPARSAIAPARQQIGHSLTPKVTEPSRAPLHRWTVPEATATTLTCRASIGWLGSDAPDPGSASPQHVMPGEFDGSCRAFARDLVSSRPDCVPEL